MVVDVTAAEIGHAAGLEIEYAVFDAVAKRVIRVGDGGDCQGLGFGGRRRLRNGIDFRFRIIHADHAPAVHRKLVPGHVDGGLLACPVCWAAGYCAGVEGSALVNVSVDSKGVVRRCADRISHDAGGDLRRIVAAEVVAVPVPAPLRDVAVEVVEAVGVRLAHAAGIGAVARTQPD